jgi:hypothetical protein
VELSQAKTTARFRYQKRQRNQVDVIRDRPGARDLSTQQQSLPIPTPPEPRPPEENFLYVFSNVACPVTGEPVQFDHWVDYRNEDHRIFGRIYVSSASSGQLVGERLDETYERLFRIDHLTRQEKKFIPDLNNRVCPVLLEGELHAIQPGEDISIEFNGMMIHFCSTECVEDFLEYPEMPLRRLMAMKNVSQPIQVPAKGDVFNASRNLHFPSFR